MTYRKEGLNRGQPGRDDIGLGPSVKALLITMAVLLGVFDHMLHGWGRAAVAAGAGIVVPTVGLWKFWGQGRFWVTVALLTLLQVPLVVLVRPITEQIRFLFMLAFAAGDSMLVIWVIVSVCSESGERKG